MLEDLCQRALSFWYAETYTQNNPLVSRSKVQRELDLTDQIGHELWQHLEKEGLIERPGEVHDAKLSPLGLRQAERSSHTPRSIVHEVLEIRRQLLGSLDSYLRTNPDGRGMWINHLMQGIPDVSPSHSLHAQLDTLRGWSLIYEIRTNEYALSDTGVRELARLNELLLAPPVSDIAIPKFGGATILTGAGFSANFGGYLASDFLSKVYDELICEPQLMDKAYKYSNFEDALFGLEESGDLEAAHRFRQAILKVYLQMDDHYVESSLPPRYNVSLHGVGRLLSSIMARENKTAYLFTLNQDLLLERCFWHHEGHGIPIRAGAELPRRPHNDGLNWFTANRVPLDDNHVSELVDPTQTGCSIELSGQYNYIKLHGSIDWRSAQGDSLVLGGGKSRQLGNYPLLGWYLSVFKSVLNAGGTRLLIIGYGFGDCHINRIIAQAALDSGLEIFVWDRCEAAALRHKLQKDDEAWPIANAIKHFTNANMSTVLPADSERTREFEKIRNWLRGA